MSAKGDDVWTAAGMSQDDFMLKDECIAVNYMDEVVGHDNKYNCHKFIPGQPHGILHRAFSVMLFDSNNRLLLQQRAQSKITFPGVWTNTCCSHPLFGMKPNELDSPQAIASGNPMGVKHAAVRKLNHELGIPTKELDANRFKFITRVHYWAADVGTHGDDAPWGEHEIDHLLLYRLEPGEALTLRCNAEEVGAVRWISREDLHKAMSGADKGLSAELPLWSPWFRIIAERIMDTWWKDLDEALTTDKYVDTKTIHRFDTAHVGGSGKAAAHLDAIALAEQTAWKEGGEAKRRKVVLEEEHNEAVLGFMAAARRQTAAGADVKQGGYGKVITHKFSKFDQLSRPLEIAAALRFKFIGLLEDNMKPLESDADIAFCAHMLNQVSRSFAFVIRQLPAGLCVDICIFYLVLRALDTVEDDMDAYKGREKDKQEELINFGAKRLTDVNCSVKGVGAGDEATLIENFGAVARVFKTLSKGSQEVIMDITNSMGAGMAEYVTADLGQGCVDGASYDRYCHMVAGLVGEGLSRIFVANDAEDLSLLGQGERVWPFCDDPKKNPANLGLANSMGLFLQKTNIIRDYLEDYVDGRSFWPQSVWKKHTKAGDLGEFARPTAHGAGVRMPLPGLAGKVAGKGVGFQALHCLNELVADALELVPDCLEYLERLRDPAVYRFCAIPQVMAIATLNAVFDNPKLFTGVVKIRKGLTARLMCGTVEGPDAVFWWFSQLSREIAQSVESGACSSSGGPIGERVLAACKRIDERTNVRAARCQARAATKVLIGGLAIAAGVALAVKNPLR